MDFQTNHTKKISFLVIFSILFLNLFFLSIPKDVKALSLGVTYATNAVQLGASQLMYDAAIGTGAGFLLTPPGTSPTVSVDPVLNGQTAEKSFWDSVIEYTKQAGIL